MAVIAAAITMELAGETPTHVGSSEVVAHVSTAEAAHASTAEAADVSTATEAAHVAATKSTTVAAAEAAATVAAATTAVAATTTTTSATRLRVGCKQAAGQDGDHQASHDTSQHGFFLCVRRRSRHWFGLTIERFRTDTIEPYQ
jgi:hypothetical protein